MKKRGLKIVLIAVAVVVIMLGVTVAVVITHANKLIKAELESMLGKDFSIQKLELNWGKVEGTGISFKGPAGKEILKIGNVTIKANFLGFLRDEYVISSVLLKDLYMLIEVDRKGNVIMPALPSEKEKKDKEKSKQDTKESPPVLIKSIVVRNGSIDYLDRKTAKTPILTKVRNIQLDAKDIAIPLGSNLTPYTLKADVPGNMSTGTLMSKGKVKLKTQDTDSRVEARKLDITAMKPYFQKEGSVNVTKGFLDLDMDVKIASRKIRAPGSVVLKDLAFESGSGMGSRFLGVPLSMVVGFMKNSNNEIPLKFVVEGSLDNPKFSLAESMSARFSSGLAEKLGLSVKGIGGSAVTLGSDGTQKVGEGIRGLADSIKKRLGK
ncbi:MAG TPA: DUF748 domain-containing protein [Syntrophorhabdaceae bacterium]|nr:DUF748 domain-containing protein [Syntrophorhabdaceae bacterium]HNT67547.1 DUF748 domain-containing protein [Syntrophorhabdaceae bacterium]